MEYHFSLPLSKSDIKKLHIGDIVYVSGRLFTARDETHKKLLTLDKDALPFDPSKMALYHCGPLMKKKKGSWQVIAAGPTTSSRMEPVEDAVIKKFGINFIIGKGGMGKKTLQALQQYTGVYASFTGGAGALAADLIVDVPETYWLDELGMPEAVWIFTVKNFGPLVVAMDAYGKSLYRRD